MATAPMTIPAFLPPPPGAGGWGGMPYGAWP